MSVLAVRDDQKRTVTAAEAFLLGADYIVVGRSITKSDQPRSEAEQMQETIRRLFAQKGVGT